MRNGSSGHDGRGRQSVQHPYQGQSGPLPEVPYGPEVSWPSGFRRMEFDTGEYNRLVDDYSRPGPGYGDPGWRPASRQPAADDYGYGDPGYADPRYDGPRDRYSTPPSSAARGYRPPADDIYPVTGAMEVLRDSDYAPHTRPGAAALPPALPALPPAADPRLAGIRYDELRYDDSRYDEPLSDEAWYAELRRDPPPARPDQRQPGGRDGGARRGQAQGGYGGPGPAPGGHPGSAQAGYGRAAGYGPDGGQRAYRPAQGEGGPRMHNAAPAAPRPAPAAPRAYLSAPVAVLAPPPAAQRAEAAPVDTYWQQDQRRHSALLTERRLAVPDDAFPETGGRRTTGRRRGRSSDHRLWLGLGGVVIVAAAAIFGIVKFEFGGGGGPAHTLVMPQQLANFTQNHNLAKAEDLTQLCSKFAQTGQMSGTLCAAYSSGPGTGGVPPQSFVAFGAHLPNDSASASMSAFMSKYPTAQRIPAGPLGGEAVCAETSGAKGVVAQCWWFDNDTVGAFMSSIMSARDLANVAMTTFRPAVELAAK